MNLNNAATMKRHTTKVEAVAAQLRNRRTNQPVSIKKKAVSHQVPKRGDKKYTDDKIDVSTLDEVLAIDVDQRTCTAEPGVTFVDLVRQTLQLGLVPKVVPELKTITIGGAVSGCSLESMSFKYGGFHDTCLEYEVLSASGEVLRCSPGGEDDLLFQMLHGSFGTLGILTKLVFELVPAKPLVQVTYERFETISAYKNAIARHAHAENVDFLDGFVFSPSCFVLNTGRFTDHAPYTNCYDWTKVYFESTRFRSEDYLRTPDYFFRYDCGVTNVHPKSFLGRLLLGRVLDSATVLRAAEKLHRFLSADKPTVTVDLFLPFSKADEYLRWHDATLGYYPLWCVPYRRVHDYPWIAPDFYAGLEDDLFLDLAIYGLKQPLGRNLYAEIEAALPRFGGIKTLISHNYYDQSTFWRIFNRANYDAVKRRMDPRGIFRDLYDKTCRAARGLDERAASPVTAQQEA